MLDTPDNEQREADWLAPLPLDEQTQEFTEEELTKQREEKAKIAETESEESRTVPKRKGYRMFIHGSSFIKTLEVNAKFSWEDKVTRTLPCIFKNENLIGI